MIHHREKSEVNRFDLFKLIILMILLLLLLWFWLSPPAFIRGSETSSVQDGAAAVTTNTETAAGVQDATVDEAAEVAETAAEELPQIDAPQLEAPALGDGLVAGGFTLSGRGTPGSTVRIMVDGQEVGTTDVGADGRWLFDLDLAAGTRELSLEALNPDGSLAALTELPGFEVVAPRPALDVPTLDLSDGDLPGGPLTLAGRGTPGSVVGIVIDGELIGTADVGADGAWSLATELAGGNYDLRLQAIDADENISGESETMGLSVAAPLPEFVLPALNPPALDQIGGELTLSGTGSPGTEVDIVVNGEVVGTAVVAEDGTWEFPVILPSGDYDVSLRTTDSAGAEVETEVVTFSLAAASPTLESPADGSQVDSGELTLAGTGSPGLEVEILAGAAVVGTAEVAGDGTWRFSYEPTPGDYSFAARYVGTTETSDTKRVTVEAKAVLPADYCQDVEPGIDRGDTYVVGVCEWLVKIANRLGIEYPALIGVNPQIENPNLIYPGQVIHLPPR